MLRIVTLILISITVYVASYWLLLDHDARVYPQYSGPPPSSCPGSANRSLERGIAFLVHAETMY